MDLKDFFIGTCLEGLVWLIGVLEGSGEEF